MNTTKTIKNHSYLILFILCPFIYGQLIYNIKVNFDVYQMESFYFYYGNFTFVLTCVITGLFLFAMILLYIKILDTYENGKIIGLLSAGILPISWLIIILIASQPDIKNPFCTFLLNNMKFLFYDNDILSAFIILITLIVILSFIQTPSYISGKK